MVDAACRISGTDNEAYIFSGTKYMRITYQLGGDDSSQFTQSPIIDSWEVLKSNGFGTIDAMVRVPGSDWHFYFFSGAKYLRLNLNPNTLVETVVDEAASIYTWKTLERHGFDRVDAAMVVPGSEENLYLFRGKEWIDMSRRDQLISRGTIHESWPSLVAAGFETVDAIIENTDHTYYVFSGHQYARIGMEKDKDTLMGEVRDIKGTWNSLQNWP